MSKRRRGWGRGAEGNRRTGEKRRGGVPHTRYRITFVTKAGDRLDGTIKTSQSCEVGEIVVPLPDESGRYPGPRLGRVVKRTEAEAPHAAHLLLEEYTITSPGRPFEPIEWSEPDRR